MKKYILLLLTILSFTAYSQTSPTLPSGAKPYGNQLYILPSTGDIWGGNAGYKYRVVAKKSYVDSLTVLGYKKTQVDSLLALKENLSNKVSNLNPSATNYPNVNAVNTGLATKENTITATTTADYYRGDKTFATLNKTAVGLSNVDNTSDANKPLSVLAVASYNAASGVNTPLTNSMSAVQMFQNLQKQNDNKAPISGSANYIQNQFATAQSGNLWINGIVRGAGITALASGSGNAIFSAFQAGVRDWSFGQRANQTFVFNNGSSFAGTDLVIISTAGDITATGKMIAGTAPTNATDVVRLSDMRIVNTTTTALSSATLNSTYPNVIIGFRVICHLITGAPAIYTKATENGSSDVWLTTTAIVTP